MLPRECYLNVDGITQVKEEGSRHNEVECVYSIDGELGINKQTNTVSWIEGIRSDESGIFIKVKGAQFPTTGLRTPQELFVFNWAKTNFVEPLKLVAHWTLAIPVLFALLSRKRLQRVIDGFLRMTWRTVSPFCLKDRYLTKFAKELHKFIFFFLLNIGVEENSANKVAVEFSNILDADNAYAIRLKDMMSLTSKEKLRRPRLEIKRICDIIASRGDVRVAGNIQKLTTLLRLLLLVPRYRKAFAKALEETDISALQLQEQDIYWGLQREDYNVMGLDEKGKEDEAKWRGYVYPPTID